METKGREERAEVVEKGGSQKAVSATDGRPQQHAGNMQSERETERNLSQSHKQTLNLLSGPQTELYFKSKLSNQ